MPGAGPVHRRSLVSAMEASPCGRIEMARTLRFKQRRPFYLYLRPRLLANLSLRSREVISVGNSDTSTLNSNRKFSIGSNSESGVV
jgi:hypothetical protein